jgi:hypothetical protein
MSCSLFAAKSKIGESPRLYYCLTALFTFVFLCVGSQVGAYVCGDSNGDQVANIGDAVHIINYVFKGGPPPNPIESGDFNGDDDVNVADAVYLIGWVFKNGPGPICGTIGYLTGHSGCNMFGIDRTPPNQDCIEYQYDGEGRLLLTHVNAGFNCCPDTIAADITIEGNVITISESQSLEVSGGCDCLCLFDLYMEIDNLPPGEYTISVSEIYTSPEDELLEFTINLTSVPSTGSFCVARDHYPWDYFYTPSGSMIGHGNCKNHGSGAARDSIPPNQDCMEYEYDGQSVLTLTHINAGFNCCPIIHSDISFDGNLIIFTETETYDSLGACYCLCLFDVDYEITGLYPGVYTIRVVGLYLHPSDDYLEFTIDLTSGPTSDISCKYRDYYPWEEL